MKLNRVLIVIKMHAGETVCAVRAARLALDKKHADALSTVERSLSEMKIEYRVVSREKIPKDHEADLIIPVGGDGTFLAAVNAAGRSPLLGVNAAPERSIGFFCAADENNFPTLIERIRAGRIRPRRLPLIETKIDGRQLPCLALNDVLFAAESPAETVRYCLKIGRRCEDQKSSGIWIAAGPGSTAAISAAGGRHMPIASQRIQYLVREACPLPGGAYRLTRGVLPAGAAVEIFSEMKCGTVYMDGHWHSYRIPQGGTVSCRIGAHRLSVFR